MNFEARFDTLAEAAADDQTDENIHAMVSSGFLLARSSCDEFFQRMAVLQRDAKIGRDMVAPILTVLTGIITLRKFSTDRANHFLTLFNLVSNAELAGISLIDKHFLFEADNIADVRELTFKALAAHETGILQKGTLDFDTGVGQLIEHQAICTPASILHLTKLAIKATEITPDTGAGNPADEDALAKLGLELGIVGPATPAQALALTALYRSGQSEANINNNIALNVRRQGLGQLVTDAQPPAAVPLTDFGKQKKDAISAILKAFSPETQAKLLANVQGVADGARSSAPLKLESSTRRNVELIVR